MLKLVLVIASMAGHHGPQVAAPKGATTVDFRATVLSAYTDDWPKWGNSLKSLEKLPLDDFKARAAALKKGSKSEAVTLGALAFASVIRGVDEGSSMRTLSRYGSSHESEVRMSAFSALYHVYTWQHRADALMVFMRHGSDGETAEYQNDKFVEALTADCPFVLKVIAGHSDLLALANSFVSNGLDGLPDDKHKLQAALRANLKSTDPASAKVAKKLLKTATQVSES
jgi:hypothetical protein